MVPARGAARQPGLSPVFEGGMGVVVVARHKQLGEQVAIKLLHPDAALDGEAVARLCGGVNLMVWPLQARSKGCPRLLLGSRPDISALD
jgi:hypothetical protein